ncbi:MAG: NADPH:quinone reductase [Actinobacteria bacterium HGW-Actinobacteria-11]|nr:MAG: NADPH:quinone reductase [Actinobacteria bacterium HGW-Actinobacteria-11]
MKVVAFSEFGAAPTVTDIEVPEPGEGEVRVKVHAASVNGFDLAVAGGMLNGAMEHRFPVVLGKDFAGVIDAVGDGVGGFAVGDRVFGVVTKEYLGDGSFAEYVTVPVAVGIAKLPDGVDFTEAAGLGLAGTAAVDAFDAAAVHEGETVLVFGATGGVGQQALQLAVDAGATVIATASSEEEKVLVTNLGAAHTVDYKSDVTAQVKDIVPEGVDVVLHFAADPTVAVASATSGGRFVSTLVMSPDQVPVEGVRVVPIYATPSEATLGRLADNHVDKRTTVTIQQTFALEQVTEAFAAFGAGTLGKIVVTIN